MEYVVEIRAAEGGDDSKHFVLDLARAYRRLADSLG
mgnify:FL=1